MHEEQLQLGGSNCHEEGNAVRSNCSEEQLQCCEEGMPLGAIVVMSDCR